MFSQLLLLHLVAKNKLIYKTAVQQYNNSMSIILPLMLRSSFLQVSLNNSSLV